MQHRILWPTVAIVLVASFGFAALLWPTEPDSTLRTVQPTPRNVLTEVGETYNPQFAAFEVQVDDFASPHRLTSTFVLPGDTVSLVVANPDGAYEVEAADGPLVADSDASWRWVAPGDPGVYPIHIDRRPSGESVTVNAFVMVPYNVDQEMLNEYRIGQYRREPYKNDPIYLPPRGFIEVTPDNERALVSPHFTLGQFLCKQESGYPKYVLLREALILKLERLLMELNDRGLSVPSLHVMSAFRTPHYNRSIGNDTDFSRHLYGGAADVFVDVNGDNYMDDLTQDGAANREDAVFMARIVEEDTESATSLVGGLGIYAPAPHRGPFIHVDVRGEPVRW